MSGFIRNARIRAIIYGLVVLLGTPSPGTNSDTAARAPAYGPLAFPAPSPGSYSLPRLGAAANGEVLASDGRKIALNDLMGDKIVLLSFIYATCTDANGCPLTTAVFHQIKSRLEKLELARDLRLLTLSFDPAHDTPAVMRDYGKNLAESGFDWRLLTTASELELNPILAGYGQTVIKEYDAQGRFLGTFSHVLRVFLIDRDREIRNIYSVAFLHADILIADIETLLDSRTHGTTSVAAQSTVDKDAIAPVYQAGDNKSGYDTREYRSQSIAVTERIGKRADLLRFVESPPLGLPAPSGDSANPITRAKIELGRKLFFDRRLSANNTFSCAMCHIPEQGFTSNEMATSVGVEGRTVRRNAPTLYNVGYARFLFHDGRESTLEQQVWAPLLAQNEMANPSIGFVIDKLNLADDYAKAFQKAYGKGPDMLNIGHAIASYERTLNAANSRFDRWFYRKDRSALDESAIRGFRLFTGKAQCLFCHRIEKDYALFTDNQFHDTGIGFQRTMRKDDDKLRVQVAPGVFLNVERAAIEALSAPEANDLGRYEITGQPRDRWKYKTPSLRNLALTAPYMHDGSLASIKAVIEFYNHGGIPHENLDPLIKPLGLNEAEIDDLIAFLNSLSGDNIETLVSDAFAVPVGVPQ
ncbi:MAG: cytochrome c peroxidase [Methylococcales bacterium]